MSEKFDPIELGNDDVLLFGENTYQVKKFKSAMLKACDYDVAVIIKGKLKEKGIDIDINRSSNKFDWHQKLFEEGLDCEILKLGDKNWGKGKFRIKVTIEFGTDEPEVEETQASNQAKSSEPESPLDDIRRMMKEDDT